MKPFIDMHKTELVFVFFSFPSFKLLASSFHDYADFLPDSSIQIRLYKF